MAESSDHSYVCPLCAPHSAASIKYLSQLECDSSGNRRFLFLDRDGVINVDRLGYVKTVSEFCFLPRAVDAIVKAYCAGWIVSVCTNQPGISEGLMSTVDLDRIHWHLRSAVESAGASIAEIIYCPHTYEYGCYYRKRSPGQLEYIAAKLGMSESEKRSAWIVGDNLRDLYAGHTFGCRSALVKTGYGSTLVAGLAVPDFAHLYHDLGEFVDFLISE